MNVPTTFVDSFCFTLGSRKGRSPVGLCLASGDDAFREIRTEPSFDPVTLPLTYPLSIKFNLPTQPWCGGCSPTFAKLRAWCTDRERVARATPNLPFISRPLSSRGLRYRRHKGGVGGRHRRNASATSRPSGRCPSSNGCSWCRLFGRIGCSRPCTSSPARCSE